MEEEGILESRSHADKGKYELREMSANYNIS
jgi:hypothetical protein